jgi:hypothetical protein
MGDSSFNIFFQHYLLEVSNWIITCEILVNRITNKPKKNTSKLEPANQAEALSIKGQGILC